MMSFTKGLFAVIMESFATSFKMGILETHQLNPFFWSSWSSTKSVIFPARDQVPLPDAVCTYMFDLGSCMYASLVYMTSFRKPTYQRNLRRSSDIQHGR